VVINEVMVGLDPKKISYLRFSQLLEKDSPTLVALASSVQALLEAQMREPATI
jgi:hypothetical protein